MKWRVWPYIVLNATLTAPWELYGDNDAGATKVANCKLPKGLGLQFSPVICQMYTVIHTETGFYQLKFLPLPHKNHD